MRLGSFVGSTLLLLATVGSAHAAQGPVTSESFTPPAADLGAPARSRPVELRLSPIDLAFACWAETTPTPRPSVVADLAPGARPPEWRERRIVLSIDGASEPPRAVAAPLEGMLPLVTGVLDELPIVAQAWAIADALVPLRTSRLVHDMTLQLGGQSVQLPEELRSFDGTIARGPYSRIDDANGTATVIDVRVVVAWQPDERIHLEAGYAIAYAGGEYGAQLDDPDRAATGHRSEFVRHGPWLAFGLDF